MIPSTDASFTTPPDAEPLNSHAPEYVSPTRNRIAELFARLGVSLATVYAYLFREIWPFSLWPAPPFFFGLRLLVRYDDVVEALGRADVFKVPFGSEMARLNDGKSPGTEFLLGIDDPPAEHERRARCLMARLQLNEIGHVERIARDSAERKLLSKEQAGPFDVIHELITAVPIDLCNRYFGLTVLPDQSNTFAEASIELSGHLFGLPPIKPSRSEQENKAGDYVRFFVDQAIAAAKAKPPPGDHSQQDLATKLRGFPLEEARAILIGMIVGFVPTNTMAGGYILDVLLKRPEAMALAVEAASSGDDDRLWQCLIEALRFRPINLGPFRVCSGGYQFDGYSIPDARHVWVMTSSAMQDSHKVSNPDKFDPNRVASSYLHFGFGMHWCIGARLAQAQLTQTFKALLRRGSPIVSESLTYRGTFPDTLKLEIKGLPA